MEKLQQYEKIPIYRKARECLSQTHIVTARMNKSYKYTLGETLRISSLQLTENIFLAYEERENICNKIQYVENIQLNIQKLLINYRIAFDLQLLSSSNYTKQVSLIIEILKQAKGWIKSIKK